LRSNGILLFEPDQAGSGCQNIIISCGIHGNETAPIEIVNQLVNKILTGSIKPENRLLFIFGNPQAAVEQQRFCQTNLNRLFCGRHADPEFTQTIEGRRAALLESEVGLFLANSENQTLHYDLHTAIRDSLHEKFAVYPFLHDRQWSTHQLAFLEACGIEAVLLSHQPSSTFSYFTSTQFDSHSFTVELGKVHAFGENDLASFRDIGQQLTALIEGRQSFSDEPDQIVAYSVVAEVIKQSEAMSFGFADQVKNFTAFERGTVLVEDNENYIVRHDSESIVFPHANVQPGERAVLIVRPYHLEKLNR